MNGHGTIEVEIRESPAPPRIAVNGKCDAGSFEFTIDPDRAEALAIRPLVAAADIREIEGGPTRIQKP